MPNELPNLKLFLTGESWSAKYARLSLPVLVRWAEEERAHGDSLREYTYTDLAIAVGQPNHAHPIHEALGILGHALEDLEAGSRKTIGVIPPIQLLVWSKGKGSPGDNAFGFLGISKEQLKTYPIAKRRSIARLHRRYIAEYKDWRRVLKALNLKPLTIDLPEINSVVSSPGFGKSGVPESEEHQRLKRYLAKHYEVLGLSGVYTAVLEQKLLSGDKPDLMLAAIDESARVCVEVKSRISDECDLLRGLFQCVKYRSVLAAHDVYDKARAADWCAPATRVMLATEQAFPAALVELGRLLAVEIVEVPMLP